MFQNSEIRDMKGRKSMHHLISAASDRTAWGRKIQQQENQMHPLKTEQCRTQEGEQSDIMNNHVEEKRQN